MYRSHPHAPRANPPRAKRYRERAGVAHNEPADSNRDSRECGLHAASEAMGRRAACSCGMRHRFGCLSRTPTPTLQLISSFVAVAHAPTTHQHKHTPSATHHTTALRLFVLRHTQHTGRQPHQTPNSHPLAPSNREGHALPCQGTQTHPHTSHTVSTLWQLLARVKRINTCRICHTSCTPCMLHHRTGPSRACEMTSNGNTKAACWAAGWRGHHTHRPLHNRSTHKACFGTTLEANSHTHGRLSRCSWRLHWATGACSTHTWLSFANGGNHIPFLAMSGLHLITAAAWHTITCNTIPPKGKPRAASHGPNS